MISTMTVQSHRMSPPEYEYSPRNANTASAPLPLIPRRTPSSSRLSNISSHSSQGSLSAPVKFIIQPSTPPDGRPSTLGPISDSDSSPSSPSDGKESVTIRAKRIRGVRSPSVCPPEQSTPTPAVHNARVALGNRKEEEITPRPTTRSMIYTPGVPLRFQTDGLKMRNFSESHTRASTESPNGSSIPYPRLIRKKSGQLVKSSLKAFRSGDSLTVITKSTSTKSEPNTPTHTKAVHFDAKLEHVKLFLAEQKPLAVSRDGSPTEDTSGTDNDFPSFIFGDDDDKPRKTLVMQVLNMPRKVKLNANVALENLILSANATCILGKVRVRNIAYAKWLAVRFTFDSWQTTSEVTAKYVESIDNYTDRFSFSIRLNDLLARIEGKRLYLAVRYTVAGMEFWDNNGGNNYVAEFTKVVSTPGKTKFNDSEGLASDISDLRKQLEKVVVQDREKTTSLYHSQKLNQDSGLKAGSLASRYDFGTSFKEPWQPSDLTFAIRHIRTQSYPASGAYAVGPAQWSGSAKARGTINSTPSLGSPRDDDDGAAFVKPCPALGLEDVPFIVESRGTNVQDNLRRAPLDDMTPLPSRPREFPSVGAWSRPSPPYGLGFIPGDITHTDSESDQSTPTFLSTSSSSNSSRATSPSPTEAYPPACYNDAPVSPNTNYRQFLNKFCFFTGSATIPPEFIPRTQSASDIEEFLTCVSPRPQESASPILATPTRSPNLDDVVGMRSGSSTPTALSPLVVRSRSATPIAT